MENIGTAKPPDTFRASEAAQVFEWIKICESGSIIGMSNVGKSALFQHLLDRRVQESCLANEVQNYLFVRINLNNLPDFENRSVYSLILDQLEMQESTGGQGSLPQPTIEVIGANHDLLLASGKDELKIQRYFKVAIRACLQDPARRLVFLFDQFDQLYNNGRNALFYNLRGLHDGYPNRIIYLVFTRQPLQELPVDARGRRGFMGPGEGDRPQSEAQPYAAPHIADSRKQAREELYELLQTNQLYLKPYNEADSERMLRDIARVNHQPFDETLAKRLYALTRGHAGLLRNCYLYALRNGIDIFLEENRLADILSVEMIAEECEKIWDSLNEDEQIAMVAKVRSLPIHQPDALTEKRLEAKGLICRVPPGPTAHAPDQPVTIFSPLLREFTHRQKTSLDRPIYLDWKSHTVYVFGKPADTLSKTEYIVLKTLYDQENTVVSMEEIYALCYPDEAYDKVRAPAAITTMMHRIRQKLHISESDQLLLAKPKQGYLLRNRLPNAGE